MMKKHFTINHFDYLQKIGLGLYHPRKTFFQQRHPSIRILIVLSLLSAITFCNSMIAIGFFFLLFIVLFLICKIPFQPIMTTLQTTFVFILFIFIVQVLFHQPQPQSILLFNWQFIYIYDTALSGGLRMLLRMLTLITCIIFFNATISNLEMQQGLEMILRPLQNAGVDTNPFALAAQIMLRFLPILALRMEQIAKSQAARGAEWDAAKGGLFKRLQLFFPFLIPLFVSSLQQAERTTEAIISRAYGVSRIRSHYYRYSFNFSDLVFLILALTLAYLGLFPPLKLF